jgi:hypothetical protein
MHKLVIFTLTNSMEHSPSWEASRSSASQEIPRDLLNPKVHYRTHKPATCPYPEPYQSSPYPPPSHFLKIHFNIILPPRPGSTKWSPSLRNFYTSQQFSTFFQTKWLKVTIFFNKSVVMTTKMISKISYHVQILCNVNLTWIYKNQLQYILRWRNKGF